MPGMLLRGLIAAFCLLPPTILMGASLPAIVGWIESTPRGVSWWGLFTAETHSAPSSAACSPVSICCAFTTWPPPLMSPWPSMSSFRWEAFALASRTPAHANAGDLPATESPRRTFSPQARAGAARKLDHLRHHRFIRRHPLSAPKSFGRA